MTPHFLSKELNFSPEYFMWANSKKNFFGLKSLQSFDVSRHFDDDVNRAIVYVTRFAFCFQIQIMMRRS